MIGHLTICHISNMRYIFDEDKFYLLFIIYYLYKNNIENSIYNYRKHL